MTQVQQAEETSVKAKVTKTKAKNTEKATGKTAKVAKVAKAKKASKATGRKLDQFGFVAGKKRSKVAEMYARAEGATTSEVKRKHGHPHLNMLGSLKERAAKDKTYPFKVDVSKKENKAGRVVTVYKIIVTNKKKAA